MLEISKPFMHDMMPLTNFYCLASANKASTSSPSLPASGETEPLLYGRMSSGNRESADPFTEAQDPSFYVTCWAWIQKFSQHMPTPSPMNDAISVPNHSSKNINLNKMRTNSNLPHICHIFATFWFLMMFLMMFLCHQLRGPSPWLGHQHSFRARQLRHRRHSGDPSLETSQTETSGDVET